MDKSSCLQENVRSRAPNFTLEEQNFLMKIVEQKVSIIENKKTDAVNQAQKQQAWAELTEAYNANNKYVSRTKENLIACYRNMKSKMKKERSEAKMLLKDPSQKESFIVAIEDNGTDWQAVSQTCNTSIEICKETYTELKKEVKKSDSEHKKKVLCIGGGLPPVEEEDTAITRIKKIIEPQIDGLYTIYDGDAQLMAQYQESQPKGEQILPIEVHVTDIDKLSQQNEKNECVTTHDYIIKKKDTALSINAKKPARLANHSFVSLAEEKRELVQLQKLAVAEELRERQLNVKLKEMEYEHRKKMNELELEDRIEENKLKAAMREKQFLLLE